MTHPARIRRMADEDWNAIGSEVDPRIHARRTLEDKTPERRAELEADWPEEWRKM